MSDGWEWVDGDIKPEVSDSSKTGYLIRKRIDDDVNYDWHSVDGYDPESKILTNTAVVTVSPKPLAAEMVSGVENSYVYTGGAIEPAVTVQDGEAALVPDTDYMVTYGANTTVAEGGTITVTGMGNYTGELVIAFSITQADPALYRARKLERLRRAYACRRQIAGRLGLGGRRPLRGRCGQPPICGGVHARRYAKLQHRKGRNLRLPSASTRAARRRAQRKPSARPAARNTASSRPIRPKRCPQKAATCTQTGLTEGSKCSVCGEMLQEQETIPALNHDYTNVEPVWNWIGFASATASLRCTREGCGHVEVVMAVITNEVTAAATCEGEGVRTYTATATFGWRRTGTFTDSKTEVIPAKGHSPELVVGESGDLHGERPYGRREVLRLRRNAPRTGDHLCPRA